MLKNFDLRQKKVIDSGTAEALGYIRDMDIDFETGKIRSVTIPKKGFSGAFGRDKSITVPWDNVLAIGSEFVIVKSSEEIS